MRPPVIYSSAEGLPNILSCEGHRDAVASCFSQSTSRDVRSHRAHEVELLVQVHLDIYTSSAHRAHHDTGRRNNCILQGLHHLQI